MRAAGKLLLTILITGCGTTAPPSLEPELPAVEWTPTGDPRRYDESNLWDAINGAADGYLAYGFVELTIQDYAAEGTRASVEIYDQGTPLGAFGVFRRDRPPESTSISAGAAALISSPHHCSMLAGAHYVQARAIEGALDEDGCRGLFLELLPTLPGPHDLPAELDLLPSDDRITGSEGFTKESYLGVTELADCLHAEYRGEGEATYKLFAVIETEGRDTAAWWHDLETKWKPIGAGDGQALHRSVPYTGEVVVTRTAKGVIGIAGASDLGAATRLLRRVVGD